MFIYTNRRGNVKMSRQFIYAVQIMQPADGRLRNQQNLINAAQRSDYRAADSGRSVTDDKLFVH